MHEDITITTTTTTTTTIIIIVVVVIIIIDINKDCICLLMINLFLVSDPLDHILYTLTMLSCYISFLQYLYCITFIFIPCFLFNACL
jgi:hypothetical protein